MAGLPWGALAAEASTAVRAMAPVNYVLDHVDADVRAVYLEALQRLRSAGVQVDHAVIEGLDLAPSLQFFTLCAEAAQVHSDRALLRPDGIGDEVRVRIESGQFVRAVDYVKAQRLRSALHDALAAPLASGADVLVTPAVVVAAPLPGATVDAGGTTLPIHPTLTRCTLPFNLSGMPAVTVPCGSTPAGLPVGLQLAAARGDDARLLAVATLFAEILGR